MLPRGKLQAVVNKDMAKKVGLKEGNRFEVHTPNAVAGVRGTDFFVYHNRNVTGVLVREGTVYAYNPALPKMVVNVPAGTVTTILPKNAPQPPRAVAEADIKRFERDVAPKDRDKEKAEEDRPGERSPEQGRSDDKPGDKSRDMTGEKGRSAGEQGRADGKPPAADIGAPQSAPPAPGFLAPPSGIASPESTLLSPSSTLTGLTGNDSLPAPTSNPGNPTNYSLQIPITDNPGVPASEPVTVSLSGGPGLNVVTSQSSASFTVTSNKSDAQYTYTLDGVTVSSTVFSNLTEGPHIFTAAVSDGKTSGTASYTWTTDYTAPSVTLAGGPTSVTNASTAHFSVTSQEQGTGITYTLDGAVVPSSSLSNLSDGKHTFEVIATDLAGNTTTQTYFWTVDTTAPSLSASGVPGSLTNKKDATLAFTVTNKEEGVSYSYTLDGAAVPSSSLSNLSEGQHTFEVTATDLAGNITTQQYSWTVDTVAPVVSVTGGPGSVTNSKSASFTVTVQEQGTSAAYTLDDKSVSSPVLSNLSEGPHTFTATVTDPAGNAGSQTYTWTTDYTAPVISLSGPAKGVTNSRSADFPVNSTETGVTYSYTLDGVKVDSSGLGNLSEGQHTIEITAKDGAGNTSSPLRYTWTTDYTAPTVSLTGKPSSLTNANTASFSAASTETGVTYGYTLDGSPVSSGSLSGLSEGPHTFIVTATDEAGNTSAPESYAWTTDYTAPVVAAKTAGASPTGGATTTVNIALSSNEAAAYTYSLSGPVSSSGAGTSGSFTFTGLTAGSYTLTYGLTDEAGNSDSGSDSFTLHQYSLTGSAAGSGVSGSVSSGNVSGILDANWGGWSLTLSGAGSLSPVWQVTAGGSVPGGIYWVDSLLSSGSSDFHYLTHYVLGSGTGSAGVTGSGPYTFTDTGSGLEEASLAFFSGITGGLMFRDRYSTNPSLTNYTAPTPEGTLEAYLGGTASLWSGSSTPFVMIGTYAPSLDTNFSTMNYHWGWENPVTSHNYTTNHDTTYDSGAYYGYASGITSGDETQGVLYALYVDPSGKAGILKGSFGQGGNTGDLYEDSGMWYAEGSLERVQVLGNTSFTAPSTIDWSVTNPANDLPSANIFTATGPVVKDWEFSGDSSGGAYDPGLGKKEEFYNTGTLMRFSYLQDTSATKYSSFGIWQMESFGSFDTSLIGSNSRWMLGSESAWDVAPLVADTKPDYLSVTRIYGDGVTEKWHGDDIRGRAYGAVADWSAGTTMLLAGEALGSYNTYSGGPVSIEVNRQPGGDNDGICEAGEKCATADADYGILTTGAWIETSTFLANPSAYASLGFATTNAGTIAGFRGGWVDGGDSLYAYMDGTNSSSPITLFSDASGIRLWASGSITGTSTGTVGSTWSTWISNSSVPSSATLFGYLDIARWEGDSWMGELELLGGIDGIFQGFLEGVAAGSYDGGSFDGTAAGTANKMDAISAINTNVVKYWNGTLTSGDGGFLYGALGMLDPWAGSEAKILGYHTLSNLGVSHTWYQEVEPYNYLDSSNRKTTSEDDTNTLHGSYFGYLGGSQGTVGLNGKSTMSGMLYALFIDPSGNAGIMKGSSLTTTKTGEAGENGEWSIEFPVDLSVFSSSPGITATQLYNPGNIVTTGPTPIGQLGSGTFSTVSSIAVVTGVNDTIRFNADSTPYTATIPPGTYTYAALATTVAAALDAADPNPAHTYTVAFNGSTNRFEITANTSVDYLWGNAATTAEQILGFSPTDYLGWAPSSAMTSTYTAGNIYVDKDYSRYKSASLNGQDWGIWQADLYGTYAAPTSSSWSLSLGMESPGVSITRMEIDITSNNDNNSLKGSITGYGADISATPRTFISIGETIGTFNPSAYTWQALGMGVSIDTDKFVTMATGSEADALKKLQIPAFEVGRATLSGSGSWAAGSETLSIAMNNVIFFSSASGGTPSIWATNDLNGSSYTGASSFAGRTVTLLGNGVELDFSVSAWSGGKWMASVGNSAGNPGPYTFSCAGCPMNGSSITQIKGAAAGSYGAGALTGGTAAGVVK
ncbi:MAG: Ig-like domain-containing protein [Thermodesulfovibrionales bacterium]